MQKEELKLKIADILDIESSDIIDKRDFNFQLHLDSMAILGLLAFVNEKFSENVSVSELRKLTTLQSLINLIGSGNFED
ncbi:MAG: acyl carrier protein [Negativicutes bacterium]|nr:acyl carrier protein [Negativicutes bacterium]